MVKTKFAYIVMSVGDSSENGTYNYLCHRLKIPKDRVIIALANQFEKYAETYTDATVYLYDEKKHFDKVDYYKFVPRNCGAVGRMGVAEAADHFDFDRYIVLDDDTGNIVFGGAIIKNGRLLDEICQIVIDMEDNTGLHWGIRTGNVIPDYERLTSSRKQYNFFIIKKGDPKNYWYSTYVSDDNQWNVRTYWYGQMHFSLTDVSITFTQNQGDRNDGNAVIYNGDNSFKKSYAVTMMVPWAAVNTITQEANRPLFREYILFSKLIPKMLLV